MSDPRERGKTPSIKDLVHSIGQETLASPARRQEIFQQLKIGEVLAGIVEEANLAQEGRGGNPEIANELQAYAINGSLTSVSPDEIKWNQEAGNVTGTVGNETFTAFTIEVTGKGKLKIIRPYTMNRFTTHDKNDWCFGLSKVIDGSETYEAHFTREIDLPASQKPEDVIVPIFDLILNRNLQHIEKSSIRQTKKDYFTF